MSTKEKEQIVIIPAPDAPEIWGMSPQTRLKKQFTKIGAPEGSGCLILRGDGVYDDAVLHGLLAAPDTLLTLDDGTPIGAHVDPSLKEAVLAWLAGQNTDFPPAGLEQTTPAKIGGAYNLMLRKREAAQAYIAKTDNIRTIEWRLYKSSYKGVTDLVTKYLWPVPAFHVTRLCARLGLSPNMVTSIGAVLMCTSSGYFGHSA